MVVVYEHDAEGFWGATRRSGSGGSSGSLPHPRFALAGQLFFVVPKKDRVLHLAKLGFRATPTMFPQPSLSRVGAFQPFGTIFRFQKFWLANQRQQPIALVRQNYRAVSLCVWKSSAHLKSFPRARRITNTLFPTPIQKQQKNEKYD
jgi:hypothetical protein